MLVIVGNKDLNLGDEAVNKTVLYHADCVDGFTAAWVARKALVEKGCVAHCIPVRYGENPPINIVYKDDIYIVDFSYKRGVLLKMRERIAGGCKVIVIDHHKTAQAELEGLEDCTFDMDHCGCVLTWNHFYPTIPNPILLDYVQDWDLYKLELADSAALREYVSVYNFDFKTWDELADHFSDSSVRAFSHMVHAGTAIQKWISKSVAYHLERQKEISFTGGTFPTCFVSDKRLATTIAHALAEQSGTAGACIIPQKGKVEVSLRSVGDFDVSAVAEQNGGGGHKNAAGFHLQHWMLGNTS